MYERLGFEVQTWYRILEAPGLGDGEPADPRIRAFRPADLGPMTALDAAATGEDRAHLLGAFASAEAARVLDRGQGSLGGFVVRAPWGGGATIAPDADDAIAILHARRAATGRDKHVRAGVLADNEAGLERLLATGWTEAWHAPRLVRGEPLHWMPKAIWGQFNHALGVTGACPRSALPHPLPDGRQRAARLLEVDPVVAGGEPEGEVVALRSSFAVHAEAGARHRANRAHRPRLAVRSASNQASSPAGSSSR